MKRTLLAGLLLAAATLALPAPAEAAACSGRTGVTVVVQYDDSRVEVGCDRTDPSNGYDALQGAGFTLTTVPGVQGSPICQINGYPVERSRSSCWTPPKTWSYWRASPGGTWAFSTAGAGGSNPAPGTVEGWRFDSGTAPSIDPPGVPASSSTPTGKPTTRPSTRPTTTPSSRPTSSSVPAPGTRPTTTASASTSASGTPSAGATSSPTPVSPEASVTPSVGASSSSALTVGDPTQTPQPEKPTGLPWIWGVVLVAILGTAGAATAVIRRRS